MPDADETHTARSPTPFGLRSATPRIKTATDARSPRGTTRVRNAAIPTSAIDPRSVIAAINDFPGIRVVAADHTGLLTVTADRPVNRTDLADAIVQAGYTVLA